MSGLFGRRENCCCGGDLGCCPERCCEEGQEGCNPFPDSLTLELSATFTEECYGLPTGMGFSCPPPSDCLDMAVTVTKTYPGPCAAEYRALVEKTCSWGGCEFLIKMVITVHCFEETSWRVQFDDVSFFFSYPYGDCAFAGAIYWMLLRTSSCNPILASGSEGNNCISCEGITCTIGEYENEDGYMVPVIVSHPPFCLHAVVYEGP